jgi:hypothetical protein
MTNTHSQSAENIGEPQVKWYQGNIFLALVVTLFCFSFTYFIFGFYYVDYEGLFDALYSGKLTPGVPFGSIYFLANIGVSHLYSVLYTQYPQIEWLSWILYSYLLIATFLGLYLVALVFPRGMRLETKVITLFVVYWLVFADHNVHFIFTRVSYMLCGLSLVSLIVLFPTRQALLQRKGLFLLLNVSVTLGVLTRVESGTATISLLLFFGWFYLQNITQCIRLFFYPLLLTGALVAGITYQIKTSTDFYLQIEPDIELQYGERQNIKPLSDMRTHRDSTLYITAYSMMWSDPAVLSPTYLRSLVRPEGFIYTDQRQWHRTLGDLSSVFYRFRYLIMVWLLLALALFIQYPFSQRPDTLWYWLAFELSFFLLNTLQTYTAKINDRSFAPYISLFIFCHVILLICSFRSRFSRKLYPIFVISFFLFFIHVIRLKTEARILQTDLARYVSNLEKIKQVASGRYLVLNSTSIDYLCLANSPFHPFDFSAFKRVYITDGSMIPFIPYYRKYLERECKCNMYEFPGFWRYLQDNSANVVIVSEPKRMQIVRDYLMEIHKFSLPLSGIESIKLQDVQRNENRGNPDQMKIFVYQHP